MKKISFIVKLIIFVVVFLLMILVTVGLFTTGHGRNSMMTNEELSWQKTRLITLSVIAGFFLIGIISFGTFLILKNKKIYDALADDEDAEIIDE